MSFTWKFDIDLKLESVHTEITGPNNFRIRLVPRKGANFVTKIEGGVSFSWQNMTVLDELEQYFALVHKQRRIPIQAATRIDTTIYDVGDILSGIWANVPYKVPVDIQQPRITVTPRMQLMSIEAGKGIAVFVDCLATYTPGKVTVNPPDLQIPTPAGSVTIPIGPFDFNIGAPGDSRLRAEYELICTDSNETPRYEPQFGALQPFAQYKDSIIGAPGVTDVRVENTLFQPEGATKVLSWKMTAPEGAAQWYMTNAISGGDTTPCKASPKDYGLEPRRPVTRP